MRLPIALLSLIPMLASCGKPELPWEFSGCDPLDETRCALPFPSSVHLRPDETSETGWRVALDGQHLPLDKNGLYIDMSRWNERDGFSVGTPLMAHLGVLDESELAGHDAIGDSLAADSRSLLLDLTTGERVAHFVEVDAHAEQDEERLTTVWPVRALDFNHHYLVAFRDLHTVDGSAVQASAGFAALRDDVKTEDPDLENRRRHYDEVLFPALEEQGWTRDEVVLAWDLHTASRKSTLGRAEHMLADALSVAEEGLPYTWTEVETNDCSVEDQVVWKTLWGRFTVPSYTETAGPNTFLTKGEDGLPVQNGTREPTFVARIPCSVWRNPGPTFVMQYGHGLLGSEGEARTGWLARFLDEHRMIVVAAQQTGMATEDYAAIGLMMSTDLSRFPIVPERLHQGLIEQALLMRLTLDALATDEEFQVDGTALIDPTNPDLRGWYGISQGGIVGGAYVGLSPDLERGVLGVGGGPYPLLLPRSVDFTRFFDLLKERYPSQLDQMLIIEGLLVHLWDVGESVAWTEDLREKRILSQIALGDAQVHVLGSRYQARSMGARLLGEPVHEVWGMDTVQGPVTEGSIYIEADYGVEVPDENLPPDKSTDTHECARRTPALQRQVATFLLDGVVEDTCEGPCVFTRAEAGCD